MRRPPSRSRPRIVGALGFALALVLSTQARAQEAPPLARYIPRDNVNLYFQFDGLDAHADAWKKTAASKVLNDTPAGAMIESVIAQLLDRLPANDSTGKPIPVRGIDLYNLVKHLARSGFVFAAVENKASPKDFTLALVIRNGFKDKDTKGILSRMIQGSYAPTAKPLPVVRAGHKVVGGVDPTGHGFTWWVEEAKKEDFIFLYTPPETADVILETLDGKRPSMVSNPRRVELSKEENGFRPTGLAFVEPAIAQKSKGISEKLGLADFSKFEIRWGFQDDALMTVARLVTPSPRKGLLALLEGPSFEKGKLPPIPESETAFTVASLDGPATFDRLVSLAGSIQPAAGDQVKAVADTFKEKTKLRLKEDLLAHLGPRIAWSTLPTKKSTAPAVLAGTLGGMEVPRFAIVFDVDNPAAFSKTLDAMMIAVNKELKAVGKPPADPMAKGPRAKAAATGGPSIEFRPTSGESKGYVLNVPQERAGLIPATFRPTIRVGPKQVIIGADSEIARQVLELKGTWTPPSNLTAAYQKLPANLKLLSLTDPRDTVPDLLASLPGKIQQFAGTATLLQSLVTQPPGGGAPGQPPAGPPPLVLKVDPAKMPTSDAIRALLFPSILTVESTGDEIKVVSRDAFPALGDPSKAAALMPLILPAIQVMRNAQRAAPPIGVPAPATTPPGGAVAPPPKKAVAPKASPGGTNPQ